MKPSRLPRRTAGASKAMTFTSFRPALAMMNGSPPDR
jgi:hypothetical protein